MPSTYIVIDPKEEEIVGTFYENKFEKRNQKEFRAGKTIKRNGDLFSPSIYFLNLKGYYSSFNSWIDKKDIV